MFPMQILWVLFKVEQKGLAPALFLDRDGVINIENGYISEIEDFIFSDGIFELCRYFKELNYKIIVVTNQSGIGRGYFTQDKFDVLSHWMSEKFIQEGCGLDLILAATADPNNPNLPEVEFFRRKPNPGMIFEAASLLELDLSQSILIGDSLSDIRAGKAADIPNLYLIGEHSGSSLIAESFADLNQCLLELRKKLIEIP